MTPAALLLLGCLAAPAAADVPAAGAASPAAASAPAVSLEVRSLLRDFSDPDWPVRERAAAALFDLGFAAVPALKGEFRATSSYDTRRRIRRLTQEMYIYRETQSRGGFLGISFNERTTTGDPRIPEGEAWVHIGTVVPDSGAQRAGLAREDLIRALNGRPIKPGEFPTWINSQRPWTRVRLTIVRGARQFDVEATLGARSARPQAAGNLPVPEARMREVLKRFDQWWRQEFDPQGLLDDSLPAGEDPDWTLEGVRAGGE